MTRGWAPQDHMAFIEWWGSTVEVTWAINVDANCDFWLPAVRIVVVTLEIHDYIHYTDFCDVIEYYIFDA